MKRTDCFDILVRTPQGDIAYRTQHIAGSMIRAAVFSTHPEATDYGVAPVSRREENRRKIEAGAYAHSYWGTSAEPIAREDIARDFYYGNNLNQDGI